MDFDPRDDVDARDRDDVEIYDWRWRDDARERDDCERELDHDRERDPRDAFVGDLDLPRGPERELVQGDRGDLYELNRDDSRMLATIGAFRVVRERDLDRRADSLEHLREEGLIRFVAIGRDERAAVLTDCGRDVLEANRRDRDDAEGQSFHTGVSRPRELQHDADLFAAYLEVEERLREQGAEIERVILETDLKREYQEFLQAHNRDRPDSDGRPDRDAREIEAWAREHELPYFDDRVHFPDFRIEYTLDGRDRHEDVEVVTGHYRGAHAASRARTGFTCIRGGGSRSGGGTPFSPRDPQDWP